MRYFNKKKEKFNISRTHIAHGYFNHISFTVSQPRKYKINKAYNKHMEHNGSTAYPAYKMEK